MTMPAPDDPWRATPRGTRVNLLVMPRSPADVIAGVRAGRLVVRVTAPPVDDAANDAVVRLLAARVGLPRSAVTIVTGHASRQKVAEIRGCTPADLRQRLQLSR